MRKSNFALRLPSLLAEARKVAEAEGVAVNQLINVALAEKELRGITNYSDQLRNYGITVTVYKIGGVGLHSK